MKKVDYEILHELIRSPQTSFSRVGKKLHISQNTVKKKYEKMIQEKTILHNFITIDLTKIGYQGRARFAIKTNQKMETIKLLKKIPNVVLIVETFGDYDIIAFAVIKDYTNMINMSNEIKKMPTIIQANISLEKATYFPVSKQFNHLTL